MSHVIFIFILNTSLEFKQKYLNDLLASITCVIIANKISITGNNQFSCLRIYINNSLSITFNSIAL